MEKDNDKNVKILIPIAKRDRGGDKWQIQTKKTLEQEVKTSRQEKIQVKKENKKNNNFIYMKQPQKVRN